MTTNAEERFLCKNMLLRRFGSRRLTSAITDLWDDSSLFPLADTDANLLMRTNGASDSQVRHHK
jgi:hypothetical protein